MNLRNSYILQQISKLYSESLKLKFRSPPRSISSQSCGLSDDLSNESMSESAKSIQDADENQVGFIDTKQIVCNGYKRVVVMVAKCEGSDHTVQDIMEPLQVTS